MTADQWHQAGERLLGTADTFEAAGGGIGGTSCNRSNHSEIGLCFFSSSMRKHRAEGLASGDMACN